MKIKIKTLQDKIKYIQSVSSQSNQFSVVNVLDKAITKNKLREELRGELKIKVNEVKEVYEKELEFLLNSFQEEKNESFRKN